MAGAGKKTERVYQWLTAYIDEMKFSGNLKLPSENALCRRLNMSRETVRAALDQLAQEGVIQKVKGSGTYVNKEVALSRELGTGSAPLKIGLILQGQDTNANSELLEGIKSVLPAGQVDLRVFFTDNKFANERRCLQTVVHQNFQGFIVDGVKASMLNPNLDCYRVELSNDLKNWTTVLDEQGRSYENKHTDWIKGSVGRYVKLVPYDNEKPITIRVWEFEIWGAESPLSIDNMADQQLKVNESATFEIGYDLGGDKADNFEATVTSDNENVVKVTETTDDAANSKIRFTLQAQSQIGEANITVSIVNGEYVNSTAFSVEVSSDEVTNLLLNLVPTVTYAAGGDYPADANTDPKAASDGNESTVFDSAFTFDGQSVIEMMYILGEQKDVVRVRALMGERDDARGYAPAIGMKVLAKAVDTEMAEVANVDNSAQNTELAYTFDSPVKAYTLKFQFTTEDYMGVEFKELEAYGAKSDITDMTVQPDIRIYPGMADRGEPIYVTAADIEKVSLVSMQGTVMKELKSADGSTVEIETGNLPAGTYLLVIEGGSYRETAKVVIR